jgi:hypothetical protein
MALIEMFAYFSRVFFCFILHITAEQLLHLGPLFQVFTSVAGRTSQRLHVSVRFAA